MTQPGGLGSSNVFEFRRVVHRAPLDAVLADNGRRGETSVASPNILSPSDSPQQDHAAGLFHAGEGGGESFVCGGDALGGAMGIGGWFIGACFAYICIGLVFG